MRNPFKRHEPERLGAECESIRPLLLSALDGELSADESTKLKEHLEACWGCRSRQEQMERSIGELMEHWGAVEQAYLPPPAQGRATFIARLEALDAATPRPSSSWTGTVNAFRGLIIGAARPVWIGTLTVFCLVLAVKLAWREVPVVSASQFLDRAQSAEVREVRDILRPVVYQKVHIRVNRASVVRTLYRDPRENRKAEPHAASESAPGAADAVKRSFETAGLNWRDPLSATTYRNWHEGLKGRQDQVSFGPGQKETLKTVSLEGPVREAELTVRTADFHPVAERFLLRDHQEIEVAEEAYQVLSLDTLNPGIFGPPTEPKPSVAARADAPETRALHEMGADLGEQIDFVLAADHVEVRGVVSTPRRKQDLVAALKGEPLVAVKILAVDEIPVKPDATLPAAEPLRPSLPAQPLLAHTLEEKFPRAENRQAYVDRTLSLAREATARAWALRRLHDRYDGGALALLGPESRRTLNRVVLEHVAALLQTIRAERDHFALLAPAGDSTPAAFSSSDLVRLTQTVQEDLAALVAGVDSPSNDAPSLLREVDATLQSLERIVTPLTTNPTRILGDREE